MEIIKTFKTISILVALIVLFSIISVFVKIFNPKSLFPDSAVQVNTSAISTPTPAPSDPFVHPESFSVPSSYMGYAVTKVSQADLSKSALSYGNKTVDLGGTEWVITKNSVSDFEYAEAKSLISSNVQKQFVEKGWQKTAVVNGQALSPNLPSTGDINLGFIEVSNGKFQEALLEGGKSPTGAVEIKLFLSNIANVSAL